jgi:hypothetical protein
MSVTSVSVVRTIAAIEAAFWSAEREVTIRGVDDALLEHVAVLAAGGVWPSPVLRLRTALHDDLAGRTGVVGDLPGGSLGRLADDAPTPTQPSPSSAGLCRATGSPAAAWCRRRDEALLDGRTGRRERVSMRCFFSLSSTSVCRP